MKRLLLLCLLSQALAEAPVKVTARQPTTPSNPQKARIPSGNFPSSYQPANVFGVPATALGGISIFGVSPDIPALWRLAAARGLPVLTAFNLGR